MSETKPSETKPRKVIGRSVAIGLGILCILLVAGLGGAMAYYTMTINDKNNTIDSINAQLHSIASNNTNANATDIINQLNANITNLTSEKNQLQGWLYGNETLLSQTQTWLDGNITAYNDEVTLYNNEVNQYNNYVNDHSYTDEQYQSLLNQISSLNSQKTNLQNQVASLQAPNLIKVNLKSDDNHPFLQQSTFMFMEKSAMLEQTQLTTANFM